jgi:homocitrate synthase NifV
MRERLKLIDHTFNKILETGALEREQAFFCGLIKSYPAVQMFDLSLSQCCRNGKIQFPDYFRVCLTPERSQLKKAQRLGSDTLVIRWNPKRNIGILNNAIRCTVSFALSVHIQIMRASTLSEEALKIYGELADKFPVKSIIYCDDDAILDPFSAYESLSKAMEIFQCEIEFLPCNKAGLATANSLAALRCGIYTVHTVVGGIDQYCGAAMEELLMAYKYFFDESQAPNTSLAKDCRVIMNALGIEIPQHKAIIGENIFAHESGIHVDGVLKDPMMYEAIKPEEVGLSRKLVIGRNSGKSALQAKLSMLGYASPEDKINNMLKTVKQLAIRQKTSLEDAQVIKLYHQHFNSP